MFLTLKHLCIILVLQKYGAKMADKVFTFRASEKEITEIHKVLDKIKKSTGLKTSFIFRKALKTYKKYIDYKM